MRKRLSQWAWKPLTQEAFLLETAYERMGQLVFQQKKRCADAHLRSFFEEVQRTENLSQKASRPPLKHSSMDTTAPKLAWKIWKGSFSRAALASA